MKKLIILMLLVTYAFAAPFPQDDGDDELSFDDLNDAAGENVEEPKTEEPKKVESYIQKIPRKMHIKDGEELKKCLTEDPAIGHPHLIKTDIQDVAEVLITHTKTEPEHVHKFVDIPAELQKDIVPEEQTTTTQDTTSTTTSSTTEASTTTTVVEVSTAAIESKTEEPKTKITNLERKRRDADKPTKVRLPKLKKKPVVDAPKPEPITISLHEVAGFDKLKTKVKRDTDSVVVKRSAFVRPKPVSEILKPRSENAKKEEAQDDEYDDYDESLPIEGRKEPPPKFGKGRTKSSSS